ncbi:MAG: hypothetical protein D6798_04415 [Deltaproteobacteria bacterium]|nr:MAG: hypothetical protein D6798_04415 [Deltaproteobacteria bacterium]
MPTCSPLPRLRAVPVAAAALGVGTAGAGCGGSSLSQSWQLDRLRVLAVQAEPAEPRPGEEVRFESLTYLPPDQQLELTAWFACLPDQATEFGCELDASALDSLSGVDPESLTPEEQAGLLQQLLDAGLIGVEPWFAPTWVAPEDALDGLSDTERLEGVSAVVNLTAMPTGAQDEGDFEIAYKRLPISEALTPNHNPDIVAFRVDGKVFAPGGTVGVNWGQPLEIEPILADDALETYTYRTSEGVDEERTEEPFVTWYVEAGRFDQPYSLYPNLPVTWTAPLSAEEVYVGDGSVESWRLIAVIRDRRGGMGHAELTVEIGADDAPLVGAL